MGTGLTHRKGTTQVHDAFHRQASIKGRKRVAVCLLPLPQVVVLLWKGPELCAPHLQKHAPIVRTQRVSAVLDFTCWFLEPRPMQQRGGAVQAHRVVEAGSETQPL